MFKNQLLALCALFTLMVSCSKKDKNGDDSPVVNAEVKAVQDYLLQTENVKTFGSAFQQVTFTDAEVSDGFTVFAPTNSAIESYDPNARVEATTLTAAEVKDHVVKGLIKKADLTHGKKLVTISGKELIVTIDGDKIMINGVDIISNGIEGAKHVIFTIANVLCKKPGTAEITVMDGTLWSTTDTLGKAAAGADVFLYYTRADFTNNKPAFTGKTDASGKITFTGLTAGTYYLVSKMDDKASYFRSTTVNGQLVALKPVGIYQTFDQLNGKGAPKNIDAHLGDFIYQDTDRDGYIDEKDLTAAPFEVVVASNKTVQVKSLIGWYQNHLGAPFASKAEADMYLNDLYFMLGNEWYHYFVAIDGVLSDEADCSEPSMDRFCKLDQFTFTSAGPVFPHLWGYGYKHITLLNRFIRNIPLLNLPAAEANRMMAEVRGLRGLVYLELATYFGGVYLQSGIPSENQSRSSLNDTYTFIKNDLTAAINGLPTRFTGTDHRRINADACRLLLARIAMAQGEYAHARLYTDQLIQSGTYSLVAANDIFISDENAETIWNMNTRVDWNSFYYYFNDGVTTKNFIPVTRYAEVLLINTEARVNMGDLSATNINLLLNRRGQQSVTFNSAEQARDFVHSVWKTELYREGHRFTKLVKWGTALQVLGPKGYKQYHSLMPIPQYILDQNPGMQQNAGY